MSALTSVIYPALGKILQSKSDDETVACLSQLKQAFDKAEEVKPGISRDFVAYMIETLK